ncbi:4a-hydroxytetrahydrobiopterin dehydratase [Streptomyces sp. NBC_00637]|uniref:4a-hydroxytetrahydrobiopterin dehydratase n=1 Tax=Streptomyces sp. NBC_00637 TaxID=2903667 RepID=UPI00324B3EE2
MAVEPLTRTQIEDRLSGLPGWSLDDDHLTRTYRLDSHFAAASLVVHVARIQDELDHHSELTLGYNTVSLAVHTHSAGGSVTDRDVELARRVEAVAPAHGAR